MHDHEALPGTGLLIINEDVWLWKEAHEAMLNTEALRSVASVFSASGAPTIKFGTLSDKGLDMFNHRRNRDGLSSG